MKEGLKPSQAVEEVAEKLPDVPAEIIAEMREKFLMLEEEGVHPWKILCEEVMLPDEREELEGIEREIAEERLRVVQGCARVMLEPAGYNRMKDGLSWKNRIDVFRNAEGFLQFFDAIGIPDRKWSSSTWLQKEALLNYEQDGIKLNLISVSIIIRQRFGGQREFVAWMDDKEKPEKTWMEIVASWKKPEDALQYFEEIGIPEGKWRNTNWLRNVAPLSCEEGGVNKNLLGLNSAILRRFSRYRKFVAWVDEQRQPRKYYTEIVNSWQVPEDALEYFQKIGIPDEKWKRSTWLMKKSKLSPQEGGIGIKLSALALAICKRFTSIQKFADWVDKNNTSRRSFSEIVASWKKPEDVQQYFQTLGIIDTQWRNSEWLSSKAKLSPEAGGVGISLSGLSQCIRRRFGGHPQFVAVMDGKIPFINTPDEARACLEQEIRRLRGTAEWPYGAEDDEVTAKEWAAIADDAWVEKSAIVRAVAHFLKWHAIQQEKKERRAKKKGKQD